MSDPHDGCNNKEAKKKVSKLITPSSPYLCICKAGMCMGCIAAYVAHSVEAESACKMQRWTNYLSKDNQIIPSPLPCCIIAIQLKKKNIQADVHEEAEIWEMSLLLPLSSK